MLDPVDEAGRAKHPEAPRPAEADAQQPVEPAEMVHVGMRDEDVADPQQLARRQRQQVAEIEQQGAPGEAKVKVEARVAERIVDQVRLRQPGHSAPSRRGIPPDISGWQHVAACPAGVDLIRG